MLLTTPSAVELSVFTGGGGCGKPNSAIVWRRGIIYLVVIKNAPN